MFALCGSQGLGRIAFEIRRKKARCLRQREMDVVVHVQFDAQVSGLEIKDVTAMLMVVTEEVQVVAGHIDGAGIGGSPEANETATD